MASRRQRLLPLLALLLVGSAVSDAWAGPRPTSQLRRSKVHQVPQLDDELNVPPCTLTSCASPYVQWRRCCEAETGSGRCAVCEEAH